MAESKLYMQSAIDQSAIDAARHRGGRALGAAGALHQDRKGAHALRLGGEIAGGVARTHRRLRPEVIASPVDVSDLTCRNFNLEEA